MLFEDALHPFWKFSVFYIRAIRRVFWTVGRENMCLYAIFLLRHPHSLLNNQNSAILTSLTAHFLCQCHLSEAGSPKNMSLSSRMEEHGCKQIQCSVTFWSITVRDKCLHAVFRKWCVNNPVWLTYLDKPRTGVHTVQYIVYCWIGSLEKLSVLFDENCCKQNLNPKEHVI